MNLSAKSIEETQQALLYESLKASVPAMPEFLQEYERELMLTADYQRNLEKVPLHMDEIKDGSSSFLAEISALHSHINN